MPDQAVIGATMAAVFSTKLPARFRCAIDRWHTALFAERHEGSFGINALPRRLLLPRSRLQSFADVFLSTIKCFEPSFRGAYSSAVRQGISPWLRGPRSSQFLCAASSSKWPSNL